MPLYEFSCSTCGKTFEKNLPFDADQHAVRCPNGHRTVRRVYTSNPVLFKGSGFYATDHPHSHSSEGEKS